MARFLRFSRTTGAAPAGARGVPRRGEPRASATGCLGLLALQLPTVPPRGRWLVLAALGACALGCGEDVLVVNWELRSLSDAGLFDDADAGSTNPQSDNAEQARAAERQRDKPGRDHPSDDDKTSH